MALFGVLILAIYLLLQNASTQEMFLSEATQKLSEKINSKVTAGNIEWSFPNVFIFNDLYVEDQSADTLLFVKRARVTVNVLPLFRHEVSMRTVQLTQMTAKVNKIDSTGNFNFQFIVDAFKSKDTSKVKWTADFETIAFKDCNVSFHKDSLNNKPGRFNPNYVDLKNINGHIFIRSLKRDSVNIRMRKLSFEEGSGLVLSNMSTTAISNKNGVWLEDFSSSMPNSNLAFSKARIDFLDSTLKHVDKDLLINLKLKPSKVQLTDLKAFVPAFAKLNETVCLKGELNGTIDNLAAKNLYVSYGEDIEFDADFSVKNLPKIDDAVFNADFRKISVRANDIRNIAGAFLNREIFLPAQLDSLGLLSYSGKAEGKVNDFIANGVLSSAPGDLLLDVDIKSDDKQFSTYSINGGIEAHDYKLGQVLGQKSQVGNTSFSLQVNLKRTHASERNFVFDAVGKIDSFTYRNYAYKGIDINGNFGAKGFVGKLSVDDENAQLDFNGNILLSKEKPQFHFVADLRKLNLARTNLWGDIANDPSLSFYATTDFSGKTIDDIDGSFSVDNIVFHKAPQKDLLVNNFSMSVLQNKEKNKSFKLYSDYLNGSVKGEYKITSLVANVGNMLSQYLPTIFRKTEEKPEGNNFTFNFKIDNTESLSEIFPMPVSVVNDATIDGFVNDVTDKFRLRLTAPLLNVGKMRVEDVSVLFENPSDYAKLMVRMTNLPQNKRRNPYYFTLNSVAKNDSVSSKLNFSNSAEITYSGELNVLSVLKERSLRGLTADFFVNPTKFIIDDVQWNMHRSKISLNPDSLLVDNFLFDNGEQRLSIDGLCSRVSNDSISINLRGLQLAYISNIVNHEKISFSGSADGDIYVCQLFSNPNFKASLSIDSTALNTYLLGDLDVDAKFNFKDKAILFGGELASHLTQRKSDLWGGVYLAQDSMDISGDLFDIDLKFMRKYFGAVLEDFQGVATGHVRAYGKFGDFGLEGTPYARDVSFGIGLLNTVYSFSDTVYMTHNSFQLRNVSAHDKYGNTAYTNGRVTHHGFKDFVYNIDLDCHNMLALNTTEQDNDVYYGTAFGDGKVNISGNTSAITFTMNVKPTKGTKITIPIGGSADVDNLDFITFVENTDRLTAGEKKRRRREKIKQIQDEKVLNMRVKLDMMLDATPDAQMFIIMDPRQGDVIKAVGKGGLRLTYDSQTADFGMLGTYEIVKGDYQFSVQSVITRKFNIVEGSLLHWTGSPYSANLDVKAKYSLNASLVEILDDPSSNLNMANIDCLLYLTGTMQNPIIKFGLELPNADEEVKRKMASVLNTEEELNKNVASLLALGRFYTLDKKSSQGTSSTNGLSSVGFSTLSTEVSNLLSSIDNNVDVGLNYNPGSDVDATASEFEVNLSTQFMNDRLLLNGNFGYRDNIPNSADNVSSGIMDFDIEYKLSKSGKFRIKAFNRSNNSYFKQTASQTQGVGFAYREDFNSYSEWLSGYWHSLSHLFSKSGNSTRAVDSTAVTTGPK